MRRRWLLSRFLAFPFQCFVAALTLSTIFGAFIDVNIRAEFPLTASMIVAKTPPSQMPAGGPSELRTQIIQGMEHSWGLDQPWVFRVFTRALDLLTLNLGSSSTLHTKGENPSRQVRDLVLESLPASLGLFGLAAIVSIVLGSLLGLFAARRLRSPTNTAIDVFQALFGAVPSWWMLMLFIMLFVFYIPIFPYGQNMGLAAGILPFLVLVITKAWSFAFVARSVSRDGFHSDWADYVRARGLSEGRLVFSHVLRSGAGTFLTLGSMRFLEIFTTEIVMEKIAAWPGIGALMWNSIQAQDVQVVTGILMMLTYLYLAIMFVLDVLYAILDPRVRKSRDA